LNNHLHIVCLDAPAPPDYGGAIDMFYKIKALAESGKKIILHYFDYNPARNAAGLESLCASVYTYKRKPVYQSLPLSQPYIIQSRINQQLIDRLNKDDYPVLLEGLHCAGLLSYLTNKDRVILRMHNEEASYYHYLSKTESSLLKKQYFLQESKMLRRFQKKLDKDLKLACLSETDIEIFKNDYSFKKTHFIPCFIPWQNISIKEGKGEYCLYHGNMRVSENEEAAQWLIQQVFNQLNIPLIIAGKGISKRLTGEAAKHKNISLINNPSIEEINDLIQNAHINVLPSMNNTGVKLKLLNALLNGRHCITNYNGVKGSQINEGLVIEDAVQRWITAIKTLMQHTFTITDIEKRKQILALYNNQQNAAKLNALWKHYL
jgi:hypothetical protein